MSTLAIQLTDICFQIGSRKILQNVNFEVKPNTVHGFLGPNGAGKSTTMRIMTGVNKATSGTVKIFDHEMKIDSYELKNKIGFLPENPPLYEDMTVVEYLDFMAKLRSVNKTDLRSSKDEVLTRLDLGDVSKRLIGNLSRGYKQRVGFAQALIHNPEIIILDEPTLGLDPHAIVYMRELIQELVTEHTVFLSSHQLVEVEKICDEVSFIKDGSILVSGNLDELKSRIIGETQKIMVRAYGVNTSTMLKLKDLEYISYIYNQTGTDDHLSYLEIDLYTRYENSRVRLVNDLVRYGCSPIEIKALDSLENYFLKEVRK